jgi:NTE family protein
LSLLKRRPKIGLALGGGGARGGIHIGVLKVLEAHEIPIHCVAGTSIGALIGGVYAATKSTQWIEQRLHEYLESETFRKARFDFMATPAVKGPGFFSRITSLIKMELVLRLALTRPFLICKDRFRESLAFFLDDIRIEEAQLPFAAVAADLETGEEVVLCHGPMIDAVYASCTYPGVVEALRLQGRLLVDGGVISMVPIEAVRWLGADLVIAVNVERCPGMFIEGLSGVQLLFRAEDITVAELTRLKTGDADVLINPGIGDTKWYDFQKMPDYIAIGQEATLAGFPRILEMAKSPPLYRLANALRKTLLALNPRA